MAKQISYTEERAIEKLASLLDAKPDLIHNIDAEQLAKDLCDWFNTTSFSRADIARLFALVKDGLFSSWVCPTCETKVYFGEPKDWDYFQGVNNADYASFPGYGIGSNDKRCDHCRMYMIGSPKQEDVYEPDGYTWRLLED